MNDIHDDRLAVYEIGYLIISSVPEEQVSVEVEKVKKIITDAGSSMIADESPHRERLAYTMRRKTVSGSYEKYDEAYFGWIKFELASGKIESVKDAVALVPSVLRMLLISTVEENTYLGKRAADMVVGFSLKDTPAKESPAKNIAAPIIEKKAAAPATIEEMDKSIDEMVKEV
jgi:ribosomal protein S6